MATFSKRAAHSINHMFSLLCLFVAIVVFHFGFETRTLALIASIPGNCLPFTFKKENSLEKSGDTSLEVYAGIFRRSRAAYSVVCSLIMPKFELI